MKEDLVVKIENVLNDAKVKQFLSDIGHSDIAQVKRVSNAIGEIFMYCIVHQGKTNIDGDKAYEYAKKMDEEFFECAMSGERLEDKRAEAIKESIATELGIDSSKGEISKEEDQQIKDYFLKNYVENGFVMHSFSGGLEESIRQNGLSPTKRVWDNNEINKIAKIFENKNVLSPLGAYSHYPKGNIYVEHNATLVYGHAIAAPEWFKRFTSANHNGNSFKLEKNPYYTRNYEGSKQNVSDLCENASLNSEETEQVMDMFEKTWELLGTDKMCIALIPKKAISKVNIEDATYENRNALETISDVITDRREQFTEYSKNALTAEIPPENMLIMELPRSKDIFKEVQFDRETKEELYDPKDVISLIHIGTQIYGFDLSQEKIEKVIKDLKGKNGAEKVDQIIAQYKDKIKNADKQNEKDDYSISTREIGTATMGIAIGNKKTGQKILRADAQQDLSIQQG